MRHLPLSAATLLLVLWPALSSATEGSADGTDARAPIAPPTSGAPGWPAHPMPGYPMMPPWPPSPWAGGPGAPGYPPSCRNYGSGAALARKRRMKCW